MLEAARDAAEGLAQPPCLLGVTVLTSLSEADLDSLGLTLSPSLWTERLAALAADSGIRGLVCSPREAALLRLRCGRGMTLVVPGIRPAGSALQDQARTAAPAETIRAGADFIVVGRPILQAPDRRKAARRILLQIEEGLQA